MRHIHPSDVIGARVAGQVGVVNNERLPGIQANCKTVSLAV